MVALGVIELMVTDCTDVYVPAFGLNSGGSTTGRLIVYSADPTALFVIPLSYAMALIVCVLYSGPRISDQAIS
jgi:hypothetical protein